MKLYLGVIDIPYDNKGDQGQTTGTVAKRLEETYGVIGTFYNLNENKIVQKLTDNMAGAIQSLFMGAPPQSLNPFLGATSEIEDWFKNFLSSGVMEGLGIPGVPTQAALDRRSLRFKKKKKKPTYNAAGLQVPAKRPSFIDTGLYQASFKVWVA